MLLELATLSVGKGSTVALEDGDGLGGAGAALNEGVLADGEVVSPAAGLSLLPQELKSHAAANRASNG